MKARILAIVFSKVLIDFSPSVNAQQTEGSLSAMKGSYPAFTSEYTDETLPDSAIKYPEQSFQSTTQDDAPYGASGVIYKMTQQLRINLESQRVRVVNSDEHHAKTRKKSRTDKK